MNKTVNINLAGRFFHIDEAAYRTLEAYLKKLKKAFERTEGGTEIIEDIEARMAELFEERKAHSQAVISEKDVEAVIEILGEPTDFEETTEETIPPTPKRRLFRDPDNRYIGGVAAGLGHYFGFEIFWTRLIWLILFLFSGGTFLVLYLIFWVLLPTAKTTAEKLQMKGEPVNISTIEKKIKAEFDEVSQKVKDVDLKQGTDELKKKSKKAVDGLGNTLKGLLKLIVMIIGVVMIFVSVNIILGLLVGLVGCLLLGWTFGPFLMIESFLSSPLPLGLLIFLGFLIALIPVLFIMTLGFKLLRPQKNIVKPLFIWTGLVLWITSILTVSGVGFLQVRNNRVKSTITENSTIELPISDTLHISTFNNRKDYERIVDWGEPMELYVSAEGNNFFLSDDWRLVIQPATDKSTRLENKLQARGKNREHAQNNAKDMIFNPTITDNSIQFPSHWARKQNAKFHNRELKSYLQLPVGQVLYIHKNLDRYMSWETPHTGSFSRKELAGQYWKMTVDGLECLDCEEASTQKDFYYQNHKSGTTIHIQKSK